MQARERYCLAFATMMDRIKQNNHITEDYI